MASFPVSLLDTVFRQYIRNDVIQIHFQLCMPIGNETERQTEKSPSHRLLRTRRISVALEKEFS